MGPDDFLAATVVADACDHAATTLSRSRVIYLHRRSVVIVVIACAWVVLGLRRLVLADTLKQQVSRCKA